MTNTTRCNARRRTPPKCDRMLRTLVLAAWTTGLLTATAAAAPGDGLRLGQWILRPYVDTAGTYDSNVGRTRDKDDDVFLDAQAGIRLGYSAYRLDVEGHGFVGTRAYADLSDNDFSFWGESLKIRLGDRETLLAELSQSYRRVEDIDRQMGEGTIGGISPDSVLDAGIRSRRDVNEAGILGARNLTDKMSLELGYRFTDVSYRGGSPLLDLRSHTAEAELAHRLTDKTDATLIVTHGLQETSADALNDADYTAARLGIRTRGTDKTVLRASGGALWFNGPGDADRETSFNYSLAASHRATDKLALTLGARSGVVLSSLYRGNSSDFQTVWTSASYDATQDLTLSASLTWREDDYARPVAAADGGLKSRTDRGLGARLRADYLTPWKLARIYAEGIYEDVTSTVVEDRDSYRLTLGMSLTY